MHITHRIIKSRVATSKRVELTTELFGYDFPLKLEPFIFHIASEYSVDYTGGYWEFYRLSNGGFFMAPERNGMYRVVSPNHVQGELSGNALGIVACLTSYSHLSFGGSEAFAQTCAKHYHLLREYVGDHPEGEMIYRATD